jgi:hypothetical protein
MMAETADGDPLPEFNPPVPFNQRGDNGLKGNPMQGIARVGFGLEVVHR